MNKKTLQTTTTPEYNENSKKWRLVERGSDGSMRRLKGAYKTREEAESAMPVHPDTDLSGLPEGGRGIDRRMSRECAMCGEPYSSHRTASGNTPPFCMSLNSLPGDTFIRGAK